MYGVNTKTIAIPIIQGTTVSCVNFMEDAAEVTITSEGEVYMYDLLIMGTQHDQQEEEEGITLENINHKDRSHRKHSSSGEECYSAEDLHCIT